MPLRHFLLRLQLVAVLLPVPALFMAGVPSAVANTDKPDIGFVLVDNRGFGDISVQGSLVLTPNLDEIASQGFRFTNYNVESQCTPTRSAIHTGRLPIRSGTHKVTDALPYGMAPWKYSLAELLSDSGYRTAAFGKWHLGDADDRLPAAQGYDEWFVGVRNTTDETGYTALPQRDSKLLPQPHAWEARRRTPV